jgi:S-adenosylmethionine-dependent methyltransferase
LRTDLAFANLEDFLPRRTSESLHALDVGGGTGATAVRLARLGFQVTVLEPSRSMLDIGRRAADEAEVGDKLNLQPGDASQLAELFQAASFDVVVCHNVLEFVDDPLTVLSDIAHSMRDSSAILSVVVRNKAGEVLKTVLQSGDLIGAAACLGAEWGQESLYGGKVRLFTPESLRTTLKGASLKSVAERGVRVLADYLPPKVSRSAEYARIFDLERTLGGQPDFAAVARYTQCLARLARCAPRREL